MDETLSLLDVRNGCPGITPTKANALYEACVYCLHKHNHSINVALALTGDINTNLTVIWEDIFDDQVERTWNDQQEATEHGAECVSIALVHKFTDFTVIRRSRKNTGFDYWLGTDENSMGSVRLEVSGIFQENENNTIEKRVNIKKKQTMQSDEMLLPAYISIVEFSNPRAYLMQK